ncbi:MAG: hypothetical protein ACREBC_34170, partial [Pyrinomonadaceae bacterium]
MNIKTLLLPAMLIALTSVTAHSQESTKSSADVGANIASAVPKRQITLALASNEKDGALLTISSDQSLADYVTYKSGDKVYCIIPQADAVLGSVTGFGFTHASLEQRDEDV